MIFMKKQGGSTKIPLVVGVIFLIIFEGYFSIFIVYKFYFGNQHFFNLSLVNKIL